MEQAAGSVEAWGDGRDPSAALMATSAVMGGVTIRPPSASRVTTSAGRHPRAAGLDAKARAAESSGQRQPPSTKARSSTRRTAHSWGAGAERSVFPCRLKVAAASARHALIRARHSCSSVGPMSQEHTAPGQQGTVQKCTQGSGCRQRRLGQWARGARPACTPKALSHLSASLGFCRRLFPGAPCSRGASLAALAWHQQHRQSPWSWPPGACGPPPGCPPGPAKGSDRGSGHRRTSVPLRPGISV